MNTDRPTTSDVSFEVAEQIVLQRMVELRDQIKRDGGDPHISIHCGSYGDVPRWSVHPEGVLNPDGTGPTLAQAIANVPDAEARKQARIAELEKELATLRNP